MRKQSKRLCVLCIVLVAVLAGCMAGCGNGKKKDPPEPPAPPVTGEFALNYNEYTLSLYDSFRLEVAGYDGVTYTSADASVASVDGTGLVTANKVGGPVVITASKGDKSDTCSVTVTQSEYEPELVLYDEEELYMGKKGTFRLSPHVVFGENIFRDADLTFASDDENVVTVDANGVITGVEIGSTTVTVTGSWREFTDLSATLDVLVTPSLKFGFSVNGETSAVTADTVDGDGNAATLDIVSTLQMDGEPVSADGIRIVTDNADVLETSDDNGTLAIEGGKATVKARGTAKVRMLYTYSANGTQYEYKSSSVAVTVNAVAKTYTEADNAGLVYEASGFTLQGIAGDVQNVLLGSEDVTAKMSADNGVTFAFDKVQHTVTGKEGVNGNGAAYTDSIGYYPYVGEYALTVRTSLYDYTADIILASHKISTAADLETFISSYYNDDYMTYTKEHIDTVKTLTSHYYAVLAADIDMSGKTLGTAGTNCKAGFTLDGCGHKIYNITVSKDHGMFGGMGTAVLKNMAFVGTVNDGLNGATSLLGYAYDGGLTVDNVFIDATMTGKDYALVRNLGGIKLNNTVVRIRYTGTAGYPWSRGDNKSYSGNGYNYVIGNALGDAAGNGNAAYANDNAFIQDKLGELTAANGWNTHWHVTDNGVTFGVSDVPVATKKNIVNITDKLTVNEYAALDLSGKVTGNIPTTVTVDGKSAQIAVDGSSITLPDGTAVGEHTLAIEIGDTLYNLTVEVTKLPDVDKTGTTFASIFTYESLDISSLNITGTFKKATLDGNAVELEIDGNTVKFPRDAAAGAHTVVYTTTAGHYTFRVTLKSFTALGNIETDKTFHRNATLDLSKYMTGVANIAPSVTINGKAYSLGSNNVATNAFAFPDEAVVATADGLPAKTVEVFVTDAATGNAYSFSVKWEIHIASVQDFLDFIKSYKGKAYNDTATVGVVAMLTADLDFATGTYNGNKLNQPYGGNRGQVPEECNMFNTFFRGTFDGQGHKIANYEMRSGSNTNQGLIGNLFGGTIKNLVLQNIANNIWNGCLIVYEANNNSLIQNVAVVDGVMNNADQKNGVVGKGNVRLENVIVKLTYKYTSPLNVVYGNEIDNSGAATLSHVFGFSDRDSALVARGHEQKAYTSDAQFFADHADLATEFTAANGYNMNYWRVVKTGAAQELYFGDTLVLADYSKVPAYAEQVLLTTEKLDLQTILGGTPTAVKLDGNAVTPDANGAIALTGLSIGEHTVFAMSADKAYTIPLIVATHKIGTKAEMEAFRTTINNKAYIANAATFYAVLTADIDYNNTEPVELQGGTAQWYNSTFNGMGHAIKNVAMGNSAWDDHFFGGIRNGSVLKNVAIVGISNNIEKRACSIGFMYDKCVIENVYVKATFTNSALTDAGLVRAMDGVIRNSVFDVTYPEATDPAIRDLTWYTDVVTTFADTMYAFGNITKYKSNDPRVPYADGAAFLAAVGETQISAANGFNMNYWRIVTPAEGVKELYFGNALVAADYSKVPGYAQQALLATEKLNVQTILGGTPTTVKLDGNVVTPDADGAIALTGLSVGEHSVFVMSADKAYSIPLVIATHKIGTKAEMETFRESLKSAAYFNGNTFYAVLTADIDYEGSTPAKILGSNGNAQWKNSTFDGMGHAIKNVNMGTTDEDNHFFGAIHGGSVLKNVAMIGMTDGRKSRACTLGYMYLSGTIENVYMQISYTSNEIADVGRAGFARLMDAAVVKNSVFNITYSDAVAEANRTAAWWTDTGGTVADTVYAFGNVKKYRAIDTDTSRKPYADGAAFLAAVGETQISAANGYNMNCWKWQEGHLYFGTTLVA